MRLLIISWEFPPYVVGGMGRHVADLTPALGALAADNQSLIIDVLTTGYGGGEIIERISDSITVYRVATPPTPAYDLYYSTMGGNDLLIQCAYRLAEAHQYDLIHIHDWLVGRAGIKLKHAWKVPLIATIHATERGRHQGHITNHLSHLINEMERQICHEAWRVIICSRFMQEEIQQYFGTPSDKISMIPNGINLAALHTCTPEDRRHIRQRYAPNGERLIFFVGRMTYEKGVQVLIEAMPQILAEYPSTRLLIAGKNSRAMLPYARELRVDNAVIFLDFIEDRMRDYLFQSVDAAIFPSLYEPFGIVALEAMALECNVIASDIGGLREIVHHMHNGLTVYPNDPNSISWAMRQLLHEPLLADQRRQLAYHQVKHQYNWQNIAEQTVLLYQRVVEERKLVEW